MNWALIVAVVAAITAATTIIGFWRFSQGRRRIRQRLAYRPRIAVSDEGVLRPSLRQTNSRWNCITTVAEQAGYDDPQPGTILLVIATCALLGGAVAWRHTGGLVPGIFSGLVAASAPYFYLLRKRHQRFQRFEQQFPDALDMMTRSIRAGYALSGAIGLVGEEMPDPIGQEFRRVFEEIRLGLDPGEALAGIQRRVPTEDTSFFYTAISIQRISGGNLAEILDRLAEVIRERFKLLKHARVLSTQHRWTAICVGLSPFVFALIFELTYPGYFDPLLKSPHAAYMLAGGAVMEAIGFFATWRIAQIRV